MAQVRAARETHSLDLNAHYRLGETWAVESAILEGTPCPVCDYPNLPGAAECEHCLASLVREEPPAAEAQSKIRHSLLNDSVEQLGVSEAISVLGTATVAETLAVLRGQHIGCVLVTDSAGKLSGIFTERDALARVAAEELDPAGIAVSDVMTPDPETVKRDHPLVHATHLMVVSDLRYLPLIDDDEAPIGVISSRDLIDYVAPLAMG